MLKRIEELLNAEESFSIETTLATKSYVNLVKRAHEKGYVVHILFFWLDSVELAKMRVADRVANGGHNIPTDVIERRYYLGIRNLFRLFMNEVDVWVLYDNSYNKGERIAFGGKNIQTKIKDEIKFNKNKESMSEAYIEDFLQKVESGLQEAQQHMLEEKALHNNSVVVSDGKGCVLEIPAKKILAQSHS